MNSLLKTNDFAENKGKGKIMDNSFVTQYYKFFLIFILTATSVLFFQNCSQDFKSENDLPNTQQSSSSNEDADIIVQDDGSTIPPATDSEEISCDGFSMPGKIVEVQTDLPGTRLSQNTYSPADGNVIYAFKMTVPESTGSSVRSITATKTTNMIGSKRVVISKCKGDYNTAGKHYGCHQIGTETTTVKYALNYSTVEAPESNYCHLTPGVWWVNITARNSLDSVALSTCSNPSNCKFYLQSN